LHLIAEPHEQPFARLALRCRASAEAKAKLESQWRKCCDILSCSSAMGDLPLPELADMASLILDDVGDLEPDGPGQERQFVPFLMQMLRSWDPDKAGLPTWTRLSVDGHSGLKRYLRDYRIQFISPWAFLAHRMTESSLVEAVRLFLAFQAAYADAKHDYRQRSGRRIGWQPDRDFFLRVDPASPPETTEVHLRGMVRVVRYLKVGPPATSLDRDSGSDSAPGPAIPDGDNPMQRLEQRDQKRVDRLQQSAQMERLRQLLRISTVFPPAYKPAATLLHRHGERLLCVCRAQAAGRSLEANVAALQRTQSQIACDCHTSQPTVSRDRFTLEEWASTIADTATEQLIGSPGFERLDASEAALERISVQLQTYLLAPLRLGEEAPLCQAIDLHLRSR
jgi:hypothetical protein